MTPHYHGATFTVVTFISIIVLLMATRLIATSFPDNRVAKAWLALT